MAFRTVLNGSDREEGPNSSYLIVSNAAVDELLVGMKSGVFYLHTNDEKVVNDISQLHTAKGHLLIVIFLLQNVTVGYAHIISKIITRSNLPLEYQSLRLPPHWNFLFKIKWIRVSCLPLDVFAELSIFDIRECQDGSCKASNSYTVFNLPSIILVDRNAGIVVCNTLDDALTAKKWQHPRTYLRSILTYQSYEEYYRYQRSVGRVAPSDGHNQPTRSLEERVNSTWVQKKRPTNVGELLERYKRTKAHKVWCTADLCSNIPDLMQDVEGALLINDVCLKIPTNISELTFFMDQIQTVIRTLSMHPIAYSLCIKVLKNVQGHPSLLKMFCANIKGSIPDISMCPYGSKVLKTASDVLPPPGLEMVAQELTGAISQILLDHYGCEVLEHFILGSGYTRFVTLLAKELRTQQLQEKSLFFHALNSVSGKKVIQALYNTGDIESMVALQEVLFCHFDEIILTDSAPVILRRALLSVPSLKHSFLQSFTSRIIPCEKLFINMCLHSEDHAQSILLLMKHFSEVQLALLLEPRRTWAMQILKDEKDSGNDYVIHHLILSPCGRIVLFGLVDVCNNKPYLLDVMKIILDGAIKHYEPLVLGTTEKHGHAQDQADSASEILETLTRLRTGFRSMT